MSLIRQHGAVLQAWACLDLVVCATTINDNYADDNDAKRCYGLCLLSSDVWNDVICC